MPHSDLIHEIFRARAVERPDAPALAHSGGTVGYGRLDAWSNALAEVLRGAGVGPGNIVPVLLPPSAELVAVLLAVLKCGAAYAALDTAWPPERMRSIRALLTGQVAVTGPGGGHGFGDRRVVLAVGGPRLHVRERPPVLTDPDDQAAMVFFTSGSTGSPKAVLSPHRATVRLFGGPTFAVYDHTTVTAQIAALPWDAFALELWGPLLTGGTCALVTERPLTPGGLRQAVARHGVDTVFLTTSLFHLFVEEDPGAFAGLRTLMVGGEKLSARHAARLLASHPDMRLVNGYGPVESAVFVLTHEVRPADTRGEVPLGRPVPRTEVLLMRFGERGGELCPPGEIGEVCVAGDGLAVGYLGDPVLTAEKFVTGTVDGRRTRLYRTGDLGRLGDDGLVHFHGRLDRQVKVRGHRLEPAGIEQAAGGLPGVRRCVVAVRRDGNGNATSVVLFYVPDAGPTAPELRSALAELLPAYSVPDQVVAVDAFPLSANGKVDTASLLAAHPAAVEEAATAPVASAGRTTGDIVAAEVGALLGRTGVAPDASFFALGGTSLTAVRLCARLGARFGLGVPVSQVMRAPTVSGMAAWLDAHRPPQPSGRSPGSPREEADGSRGAPLTAMQESFVLRSLDSVSDRDNHCLLGWTVTGPLDVDALAAAVQDVHRRHGYLRARYEADEDVLAVDTEGPACFTRLTAADSAEAGRLLREHLGRPLDLAAAQVWRAVLVSDEGYDRRRFGIAVHHAAFDGWSQHVLAEEIAYAYEARLRGRGPEFTVPVPTPARTYRLLGELAATADLAAQRAYWAEALAGTPALCWPSAGPPPEHSRHLPSAVEHPLDANALERLTHQARLQGTGLLTALVTAVWEALSDHTGQRDFAVGVPVNLRSTQELQRPVGCLINSVSVRPRPASGDGPAGIREAVARAVAGALANADLPFADVLRTVRPRRSRRHPVFQVVAAVQDSPAAELTLPGCRTEADAAVEPGGPQAELTVELVTPPGGATRLRVSRDPSAVGHATLCAVAERVADRLRSRAALALSGAQG